MNSNDDKKKPEKYFVNWIGDRNAMKSPDVNLNLLPLSLLMLDTLDEETFKKAHKMKFPGKFE